jgi:hypothetical protein
MNLSLQKIIESVKVIDASQWAQNETDKKIKALTKSKKDGELYLITTLPIVSAIETFPEGQVLTITISDTSNLPKHDIENLLTSLGQLRDYYPDLTVKVVDLTETISANDLPPDTIVKKNQEP